MVRDVEDHPPAGLQPLLLGLLGQASGHGSAHGFARRGPSHGKEAILDSRRHLASRTGIEVCCAGLGRDEVRDLKPQKPIEAGPIWDWLKVRVSVEEQLFSEEKHAGDSVFCRDQDVAPTGPPSGLEACVEAAQLLLLTEEGLQTGELISL